MRKTQTHFERRKNIIVAVLIVAVLGIFYMNISPTGMTVFSQEKITIFDEEIYIGGDVEGTLVVVDVSQIESPITVIYKYSYVGEKAVGYAKINMVIGGVAVSENFFRGPLIVNGNDKTAYATYTYSISTEVDEIVFEYVNGDGQVALTDVSITGIKKDGELIAEGGDLDENDNDDSSAQNSDSENDEIDQDDGLSDTDVGDGDQNQEVDSELPKGILQILVDFLVGLFGGFKFW